MAAVRQAAAVLALAAAGVGCGAGTDAEEGEATLTVYVSAPLSGPARADGQDVADGARMALDDARGEAGGFTVRAEYRDVAGRNESRFDPVTAAANARSATEDSTTIAYIGELDSGATRTSLPITNSAGILQVAPGSGASDLVRDEVYNDEVPSEVQGGGDRTFARLVPSDGEVGAASAHLIHDDLDFGSVLASGQGEYGEEVLAGLEDEASFIGLELTDAFSGGLAVFQAQESFGSLGIFGEKRFGIQGADRLLFRTEVVSTDAVLASGSHPPRDVHVVSAHLDPRHLPDSDRGFAEAFKEAYGRRPGRYAAYGYEAMASVLAAMERADNPADRAAVIDAYFDGSERDSVLGAYEITDTGETTLTRVTAYELSPRGRLTPATTVPTGR